MRIAVIVTALLLSGCGTPDPPDRSPEQTLGALEQAGIDRSLLHFAALLFEHNRSRARELYLDVVAEQANRNGEGVKSLHTSAVVNGLSCTVTTVYETRANVRRTYAWELVREQNRWRLNTWTVAAEGITQ
ncbi:MAG: hypothetical protein ACHQPI_07330 [Thermoanaerobaculia bacterium]